MADVYLLLPGLAALCQNAVSGYGRGLIHREITAADVRRDFQNLYRAKAWFGSK